MSEMNTHGLEDLIDIYLDRGMTADEAAHEVAEVLDAMIPLNQLGPVGMVLEALDGPMIFGIVSFVQKCRRTPEERLERRQRRMERKKERKARRESKMGDRSA